MRDDGTVPETFAARFAQARSGPGPLVWGLDPSAALLRAWGLGDDPDGLDRFADIMLAAAAGTVGLVKPQSAFFERHGWRGFRTLSRLIAGARSAGLLVVLDVKRGDVGRTNDAYAEAFLGPGAPLEADAVTVHPYLGLAAMGAFVSRACQAGSCLLVDVIGKLNRTLAPGQIGPVGAVVGPTRIEPELYLAGAQALFLGPGVGAQGATPEDVAQVFAACPDRVMPSASRSLLAAGPDINALQDRAAAMAAEFRRLLPASTDAARTI